MQIIRVNHLKEAFISLGRYRTASLVFLALLTVMGGACAQRKKAISELTPQEQLRVDQISTRRWPSALESQLVLLGDIEMEVTLRALALKLSQAELLLGDYPLGIRVFTAVNRSDPQKGASQPLVMSIPGHRVYIGQKLLNGMEYENELSALLALEFSHLLLRHSVVNAGSSLDESVSLSSEQGSDASAREMPIKASSFWGPKGVFAYTKTQEEEAIRTAVKLLYQAGYDSRGLVSYLRKRHTLEKDMSSSRVKFLEAVAREEIAKYPPLRNPTISSPDFGALLKRIKKT